MTITYGYLCGTCGRPVASKMSVCEACLRGPTDSASSDRMPSRT